MRTATTSFCSPPHWSRSSAASSSKQYILNSNLRLYAPRFVKELLRDEGMATGFLDSRYAQKELDNAAELPDSDSLDAKTGPIYVTLFHQYLRNDLGADIQEPYLPQNGEANQPSNPAEPPPPSPEPGSAARSANCFRTSWGSGGICRFIR